MVQLLENNLPVILSDGLNTNKAAMFGGPVTFTNTVNGMQQIVLTDTTTATLTAAQSGSVVLWNAAAGFTINLPAPVIGLQFLFGVLTSVTSSNHKVLTDASTTFLVGGVSMGEVAATTAPMFPANGTTIRSVTMNGTTTGGLIGTYMELTCVTATQWLIQGQILGSGTLATPFATS